MADRLQPPPDVSWQDLGYHTCSKCSFKTSDSGLFHAHHCRGKISQITAGVSYSLETARYTCSLCNVDLPELEFREHLAAHVTLKPYLCKHCLVAFGTKDHTYHHLREQHADMEPLILLTKSKESEGIMQRARNNGKEFYKPVNQSFVPALNVSRVQSPNRTRSSGLPPSSTSFYKSPVAAPRSSIVEQPFSPTMSQSVSKHRHLQVVQTPSSRSVHGQLHPVLGQSQSAQPLSGQCGGDQTPQTQAQTSLSGLSSSFQNYSRGAQLTSLNIPKEIQKQLPSTEIPRYCFVNVPVFLQAPVIAGSRTSAILYQTASSGSPTSITCSPSAPHIPSAQMAQSMIPHLTILNNATSYTAKIRDILPKKRCEILSVSPGTQKTLNSSISRLADGEGGSSVTPEQVSNLVTVSQTAAVSPLSETVSESVIIPPQSSTVSAVSSSAVVLQHGTREGARDHSTASTNKMGLTSPTVSPLLSEIQTGQGHENDNNLNRIESKKFSFLKVVRGYFLCLPCKMKWQKEFELFFRHIWKEHAHGGDFSCCPGGYSVNCSRFMAVVEAVYKHSQEPMSEEIKNYFHMQKVANQEDLKDVPMLEKQSQNESENCMSVSGEDVNEVVSGVSEAENGAVDESRLENTENIPETEQLESEVNAEEVNRVQNEDEPAREASLPVQVTQQSEVPANTYEDISDDDSDQCTSTSVSVQTNTVSESGSNRNAEELPLDLSQKPVDKGEQRLPVLDAVSPAPSEFTDNRTSESGNLAEIDQTGNDENSLKFFYKCGFPKCLFSGHKSNHLIDHIKVTHSSESNPVCAYCECMCDSDIGLVQHLEGHIGKSGTKTFSCSLIENASRIAHFENDDRKFIINMLKTTAAARDENEAQLLFACDICNTNFESVEDLKVHLQQALLNVVECKHCHSYFLDTSSWQCHMESEHVNMSRMYGIHNSLLCQDRKLQQSEKEKPSGRQPLSEGPQIPIESLNLVTANNGNGNTQLLESDKSKAQSQLLVPMINDESSNDQRHVESNTNIAPTVTSKSTLNSSITNTAYSHTMPPTPPSESADLGDGGFDVNNVPYLESTSRSDSSNINPENSSRPVQCEKTASETVDPDSTLRCYVCEFRSSSVDEFLDHVMSSKHRMPPSPNGKTLTPVKCSKCNYVANGTPDFSNHILSEHSRTLDHSKAASVQPSETSPGKDSRPALSEILSSSQQQSMCKLSDLCGLEEVDECLKPLYVFDVDKFICKLCKRNFKTTKGMHRHIFYCQGKLGTTLCPICGYQGEHIKVILNHKKKKHKNGGSDLIHRSVNKDEMLKKLQEDISSPENLKAICAYFTATLPMSVNEFPNQSFNMKGVSENSKKDLESDDVDDSVVSDSHLTKNLQMGSKSEEQAKPSENERPMTSEQHEEDCDLTAKNKRPEVSHSETHCDEQREISKATNGSQSKTDETAHGDQSKTDEIAHGDHSKTDETAHYDWSRTDKTAHGDQSKTDETAHDGQSKTDKTTHDGPSKTNQTAHGDRSKIYEIAHGDQNASSKAQGNQSKTDETVCGDQNEPNETAYGDHSKTNETVHGDQGETKETAGGDQSTIDESHGDQPKTDETICDDQSETNKTACDNQSKTDETTHDDQSKKKETAHDNQIEANETAHDDQSETNGTAHNVQSKTNETAHDDQSKTDETACDDQSKTEETACDDQSKTDETACDDQSKTEETACDDQSKTDETACDDQSKTEETACDDQSKTNETAHDGQSETNEIACDNQNETNETACDDQGETNETACDDQGETNETACDDQSETNETASCDQTNTAVTTDGDQTKTKEAPNNDQSKVNEKSTQNKTNAKRLGNYSKSDVISHGEQIKTQKTILDADTACSGEFSMGTKCQVSPDSNDVAKQMKEKTKGAPEQSHSKEKVRTDLEENVERLHKNVTTNMQAEGIVDGKHIERKTKLDVPIKEKTSKQISHSKDFETRCESVSSVSAKKQTEYEITASQHKVKENRFSSKKPSATHTMVNGNTKRKSEDDHHSKPKKRKDFEKSSSSLSTSTGTGVTSNQGTDFTSGFKCSICPAVTSYSYTTIKKHIKSEHPNDEKVKISRFQYENTDPTFKTSKKRKEGVTYKCIHSGCNFSCPWDTDLMKEHIQSKHPYYSCGYCKALYSFLPQLHNHLKFVHRGKEVRVEKGTVAIEKFFRSAGESHVSRSGSSSSKKFRSGKAKIQNATPEKIQRKSSKESAFQTSSNTGQKTVEDTSSESAGNIALDLEAAGSGNCGDNDDCSDGVNCHPKPLAKDGMQSQGNSRKRKHDSGIQDNGCKDKASEKSISKDSKEHEPDQGTNSAHTARKNCQKKNKSQLVGRNDTSSTLTSDRVMISVIDKNSNNCPINKEQESKQEKSHSTNNLHSQDSQYSGRESYQSLPVSGTKVNSTLLPVVNSNSNNDNRSQNGSKTSARSLFSDSDSMFKQPLCHKKQPLSSPEKVMDSFKPNVPENGKSKLLSRNFSGCETGASPRDGIQVSKTSQTSHDGTKITVLQLPEKEKKTNAILPMNETRTILVGKDRVKDCAFENKNIFDVGKRTDKLGKLVKSDKKTKSLQSMAHKENPSMSDMTKKHSQTSDGRITSKLLVPFKKDESNRPVLDSEANKIDTVHEKTDNVEPGPNLSTNFTKSAPDGLANEMPQSSENTALSNKSNQNNLQSDGHNLQNHKDTCAQGKVSNNDNSNTPVMSAGRKLEKRTLSIHDYPFKCFECKTVMKSILDTGEHFRWLHLGKAVKLVDRKYKIVFTESGECLGRTSEKEIPADRHLCKYCPFRSKERSEVEKHVKSKHPTKELEVMTLYDSEVSPPQGLEEPAVEGLPYRPTLQQSSDSGVQGTASHVPQPSSASTPLRYKCHICDELLTREFDYRLHLAKHPGFTRTSVVTATSGLLMCPTCGYIAKSSSDLADHTNQHMVERRFRCSQCDFDSHQRKGVEAHLKNHSSKENLEVIDLKKRYDSVDLKPKIVEINPIVDVVDPFKQHPNYLQQLLLTNNIKMLDLPTDICSNILGHVNKDDFFDAKFV